MNRHWSRLVCKLFGHDLSGLEVALFWNTGGCHRCGATVQVRRGYRTRVIRP